MTLGYDNRYFGYDNGQAIPPSPLDEYRNETGIRPSYYWQGSSLSPVGGAVALVQPGAPDDVAVDQLVSKTKIDGLTSSAWSHAYQSTATNQRLLTPSATSIDLGAGSFCIHLTAKVTLPVSGLVDIFGNRTITPLGLEIRVDQNGTLQASYDAWAAQVNNQVIGDEWFEVVVLGKRTPGDPGTLEVGTINESMVGATPLPASTNFNTTEPWALFRGPAGLGVVGQIMRVVISTGTQLDTKSARVIAQLGGAKDIWWDDVRGATAEGPR